MKGLRGYSAVAGDIDAENDRHEDGVVGKAAVWK